MSYLLHFCTISATIQRTQSFAPDEDFFVPLTPNMLITGRSQAGPKSGYVDGTDVHSQRSFLQELEAAWQAWRYRGARGQ